MLFNPEQGSYKVLIIIPPGLPLLIIHLYLNCFTNHSNRWSLIVTFDNKHLYVEVTFKTKSLNNRTNLIFLLKKKNVILQRTKSHEFSYKISRWYIQFIFLNSHIIDFYLHLWNIFIFTLEATTNLSEA